MPPMLAQLTVVIPSYGRQDFLARQCAYWHGTGATVVIVDGSERPLTDSMRLAISRLGDVTYVHSVASMMDRLRLASNLIETPYAILLGDDEFLLLEGLCSAIGKLEQDAELVACIGQSLAFFPASRGCSYGPGYPHWKYAVCHDNARNRMIAAMSDYRAASCYAVLRAPTWRRSWGQLQNWSSPYVGEIQQGLTTYIWGKLTTVDEVYWMRSSENRPVTNKDFNRGLSFQEWWGSSDFLREREEFIRVLSQELMDAEHLDMESAQFSILEAITVYVDCMNQIHKEAVNALAGRQAIVRQLRACVVSGLKMLLPTKLIRGLKSASFNLSSASGIGSMGSRADFMRSTASLPFLVTEEFAAELSEMESLIASFYLARTATI